MKHAEVKAGIYKGKTAIILGTDREYLGHSIFKENNQMGWDFMKRWGLEHFPITDPVFVCNIDGQEIALSQSDFKKGKNDQHKGTAGTETNEDGAKSND